MKSTYELFYEDGPWSGQLFPFGCEAQYLVEKEDRAKFGDRTRTGVVVGYGQMDAPLVLDHALWREGSVKLLATRDVRVNPEVFPWTEHPVPGIEQTNFVLEDLGAGGAITQPGAEEFKTRTDGRLECMTPPRLGSALEMRPVQFTLNGFDWVRATRLVI